MKSEYLILKDLSNHQKEARSNLHAFKRKMAKKYQIPFPSNFQLLRAYHNIRKEKRIKKIEGINRLLRTRPVRSLSGIVNVSVLTKPYPCPGKCIFCPQEEGIPKSYLSGEPAVERAKELDYQPYKQTRKRLETLKDQGHPGDKIGLRIIGGTWSFYPKRYQSWFMKQCFDGCNGKISKTLRAAQRFNESSRRRIVELSVETRPDFIDEKEAKRMRKLGVTKVEMGAQSLSDRVLTLNQRGHNVKALIDATRLLKDAGFKVSYQMMLNLPGSTPAEDIKTFERLFDNASFRPDSLKIYPCALLKESRLFQWYLKGRYKPYTEKTLINVIKSIKTKIPYYVRIERVIRDIPAPRIAAGPAKVSNLRQLVEEEMKKEKKDCRCIRCREIKNRYCLSEKAELHRHDYQASLGREIFLSFEDRKRRKLYSLLRMRIPSWVSSNLESESRQARGHKGKLFLPVLKNSALIREIHTYGQMVPIDKKRTAPQHKGLGQKLLKAAERVAREEFGLPRIAVISGVGARNYYRKNGYRLSSTYMVKNLCERGSL